MTDLPWLLVCDLDGTLLGHDDSLQEFERWSRSADDTVIAYATGRNLASVVECLTETALPVPQFLITNIGTEIWEMPTSTPIRQWPLVEGRNWNAPQIMKYMNSIPNVELQPLEFQTSWKVSYFAQDITPSQLNRIHDDLSKLKLEFEMIYSGERFLDFLPPNSHKGAAVQALVTHLCLSPDRVLVAGDSGNDISMFQKGYFNILVGNAQAEIRRISFPRTYQARQEYAAGVLEGLGYWRQTYPTLTRAQSTCHCRSIGHDRPE